MSSSNVDALKAEIDTKGNQQQQDHLKVIADLEAKCKAETDANNAQIQTLNQQIIGTLIKLNKNCHNKI
jgi:hypothetical protein